MRTRQRSAKSYLERLLFPVSVENFTTRFWETSCLALEPHPTRRRLLSKVPSSVTSLLTAAPFPIQAWYAHGQSGGFDVQSDQAQSLHQLGMTLYFMKIPVLMSVAEALATELGLAPGCATASAFASRAGAITPAHYDANENLTIQLTGVKRWSVAANLHVPRPTVNASAGPLPMTDEARQAPTPWPTQMPAGAHEYELRPGALLYVPRGFWHATTTCTDALSLTFSFRVPTLADAVANALRARLVRDPAWRQSVSGATRGGRGACRGRRALLDRLRDELSRMQPDDWLAALSPLP